MNAFMQGFISGALETPRGFFTPLVAVWRLLGMLIKVTGSVIAVRKS